jgi:hypothetical protein
VVGGHVLRNGANDCIVEIDITPKSSIFGDDDIQNNFLPIKI